MNLNKNNIFFLLFLITINVLGQETTVLDTIKRNKLDEVVVTGQINPQSVKKSVFEVRVLKRRDIEQLAAGNLADALNQTLNLTITPATSSGRSGLNLFGLDGQYIKILVDNIPLISDEGFGNNIDITQINLDDVEQIEFVEGSMGVQYGANAVAGVINIITKKGIKNKTEISTYLQEETVGNEYALFEKGRHIQSVNVKHNFNDNFYASLAYNRNDFGGYWSDYKGKDHAVDDKLRGHFWLPKEQHYAKSLLNYSKGKFRLFYKFEYFNERIENYDKIVALNENPATNTINPSGIDQILTSNRYFHHLNANGYLKDINYNISVSYQKQEKDAENYTYFINTGLKQNSETQRYLTRDALFSRGTFSNLVKTSKIGLQAGYEVTLVSGSTSPLATPVDPGVELEKNKLNSYDVFASLEYKFNDNFSLRSGARIAFSNIFKNQYSYSLSSRYLLKNNWELRAVVGSSNRTPNFDELYTYRVDINHNIQGNLDLKPEQGASVFFHVKKSTEVSDDFYFKNKLSLGYIDVSDRIDLIIVETNPLKYKYTNIDKFRSFSTTLNNSFYYKNLRFQLGGTFYGVSKILNAEENANDDFLVNMQLNANLSYTLPNTQTVFSAYLNHVGKEYQFVQKTDENDNVYFSRESTRDYTLVDATVKHSFFNRSLVATAGVRNLLSVDSPSTTAFAGGAHSDAPETRPIAYGRSYFLKLVYNLNI